MVDLYQRLGGEFLVNTATQNGQQDPSITGLASGGFVVTWTDLSLEGGDASGQAVKAQIFDALGAAVGAYLLNVPPMWITVGVIILIGLGILTATSRTKPRDPPAR